ncbi:hypothetical protein [Kangiella geojedonensis]|uniref:Uncharacterized protein n=1 Tax=Kangiella geojedonensis TaxID=914150 RepID=A0A0F6RBW7_9GAMM|nr:hypothetical protein [Kangiella geojedonensis]AKE51526.1 hypothetical protein TQ33_0545 [Kangiella geojedonensis]
MTYNRKTSKRVNQICLYIAIAAIGYTVAAKLNRVQPEVGVLDSLETVQTIQKGFKSFLSNVD